MSDKSLRITESDEAGNVLATYVQSSSGPDGLSRVDTIDSLQAFSSSIASLLSSRAVLSSVGVGDSTASPTAALLLSVLQESAGRIATILFAHRFGTSLEPECKMYRLLADVLNDIAFILDCLSPVFPKAIRVVVLSFSSVLRALCGVAAGSAKASLSAHFARWGNLGELNAKDSSQETVISLLGMLAGSVVVSWITTPVATWTVLIFLLSVHLETNRRAVRAVSMRTLSRQRATLVYHHLKRSHVPTPDEVSEQEQIFERDGVLRDRDGRAVGYCRVGSSMSDLLSSMATERQSSTKSAHVPTDALSGLFEIYQDRKYVLWVNTSSRPAQVSIVVKTGASTSDVLAGWWEACMIAEQVAFSRDGDLEGEKGDEAAEEVIAMLEQMRRRAAAMLEKHQEGLMEAGWDLEVNALQTTSNVRVAVT
ncbi:uncharacterized protein LTR77_004487 [Saxophila tyrrhenica]|uniref:DUF647-domain-containing protein n=1 Tax=Saxophila tyrrhenica TaxID=1690608 RepID=A0AAV9PH36_9PEZI|nr:hypothetical protein LTR77_004487 [Saxophila tyrrhenica]